MVNFYSDDWPKGANSIYARILVENGWSEHELEQRGGSIVSLLQRKKDGVSVLVLGSMYACEWQPGYREIFEEAFRQRECPERPEEDVLGQFAQLVSLLCVTGAAVLDVHSGHDSSVRLTPEFREFLYRRREQN